MAGWLSFASIISAAYGVICLFNLHEQACPLSGQSELKGAAVAVRPVLSAADADGIISADRPLVFLTP
jgi:hypothetical protein